MWNPDLMLTKAVALRRQEAQRTGADPYAQGNTAVLGPACGILENRETGVDSLA